MGISQPEGRVFKRPGTQSWWIAYYVDGKEYRESSRSADVNVARVFLRQRRDEIAAS